MKNVLVIKLKGNYRLEDIEAYKDYCKKCIDDCVLVLDDRVADVDTFPVGKLCVSIEDTEDDYDDTEEKEDTEDTIENTDNTVEENNEVVGYEEKEV